MLKCAELTPAWPCSSSDKLTDWLHIELHISCWFLYLHEFFFFFPCLSLFFRCSTSSPAAPAWYTKFVWVFLFSWWWVSPSSVQTGVMWFILYSRLIKQVLQSVTGRCWKAKERKERDWWITHIACGSTARLVNLQTEEQLTLGSCFMTVWKIHAVRWISSCSDPFCACKTVLKQQTQCCSPIVRFISQILHGPKISLSTFLLDSPSLFTLCQSTDLVVFSCVLTNNTNLDVSCRGVVNSIWTYLWEGGGKKKWSAFFFCQFDKRTLFSPRRIGWMLSRR